MARAGAVSPGLAAGSGAASVGSDMAAFVLSGVFCVELKRAAKWPCAVCCSSASLAVIALVRALQAAPGWDLPSSALLSRGMEAASPWRVRQGTQCSRSTCRSLFRDSNRPPQADSGCRRPPGSACVEGAGDNWDGEGLFVTVRLAWWTVSPDPSGSLKLPAKSQVLQRRHRRVLGSVPEVNTLVP